MNKFIYKISDYILSGTVWLFLCTIAFQTILMIQEATPQTWQVYLSYLGMFTFLSIPMLGFSLFRKKIQELFSLNVFWLIWLSVFVIYPILFFSLKCSTLFADYFQYHQGIHENTEQGALIIINVFFLLIFLTELLIQFNRFIIHQPFLNKWIKHINLEVGILFVVFLFSVFLVLFNFYVFYEDRTITTFWAKLIWILNYIFQVYIILLLYYPLYWINHYILVNKILKEKGIFFYLMSFLGLLFISYPIISQVIYFIPVVDEWKMHPVNDGHIFSSINLLTPLFGMIFSTPFILAYQWFKQRGKISILEKEKSNAELSLLKQQINPHFFFNTLNNLYALSLKKDEQTPEVILQLSDLMRYVIYKGREERVRLSEDIDYIEGYVQLQSIRLYKKLDYHFEKDINDPTLAIPPLLFIILVENAFKHGIEPAENSCFLNISIKTDEDSLTFVCENSYEEENPNSDGIGLQNLKRRLDLIYGEAYDLKMERRNGGALRVFRAQITIKH